MNILKKLFFKQKTQNIETPTHYIDILLAWFNKENSDIEAFEKEYYSPIIKELQERDHFAKHYFEAYPKEAKESCLLGLCLNCYVRRSCLPLV